MIVGAGNNNTMLIAITDEDIDNLKKGLTITYENCRMLVANLIMMRGRDKLDVLDQLNKAGVEVS